MSGHQWTTADYERLIRLVELTRENLTETSEHLRALGDLRNAEAHSMPHSVLDNCSTMVSVPTATVFDTPLIEPAPGNRLTDFIEEIRGVLRMQGRADVSDAPRVPSVVTQAAPVTRWLDLASPFIPKAVREPFLGDLREDLAAMAAAGRSRTAVRWAAVSQVAILVVRWAWSSLARLVRVA